MKLISMLITFYHFSDALSILNDKKLYKLLCTVYNESKISNLGNEIREFSEKFNLHNKVFLREYKLRNMYTKIEIIYITDLIQIFFNMLLNV